MCKYNAQHRCAAAAPAACSTVCDGKVAIPPRSAAQSAAFCLQRAGKIVAGQQLLDHSGRAVPVEGAEAVASGDEARAGVEHLVLGVARAELRADGVPRW